MNPGGIFLDRDGTINQEVNFLTSPEELELIPRSASAIQEANQLGFKVFIVTNQSGIARGLLTENQLGHIHQTLIEKLLEHNARIDAIYYCPHHPEGEESPFAVDCSCRKPNTGMIEQATREFPLDLKRSFVIGDRLIDIQLGNNAGIPAILVLTGYGKNELDRCRQAGARIEHVAADLFDAMQYIKRVTLTEQLPIS
jgi:D-glycero-D-manno-heptose 1,7-bisphosphate phosphatase